ncbi:hypothetical protein JTB14_030097 [Gonioctena quinquepunctata]|nr:hypothetical protein JTB14_030097 [Gonioctena quinquepunctata]
MDLLKVVYKFVVLNIFISISCSTSDLDIKEVARNISREMNLLKNNELGVPYIMDLYKNFVVHPTDFNVANVVDTISQKLETRIENIFSSLENARNLVDSELMTQNISNMFSVLSPCFQKEIKLERNGSLEEKNKITNLFESAHVLENVKKNLSATQEVKRQYFISDSEVKKLEHTPFFHCSGCDEKIVWDNYIARNIYQRKNVVLVLDIGGSIKPPIFQVLRAVAKKMISVLNSNDRIAFITVSSNYSYLESDCDKMKDLDITNSMPRLMQANGSYINTLNNYIDAIVSETGLTNHVLGFEKALQIVSDDIEQLKNETVMVLYVSRGLLSSLMEPKQVLEMVENFTAKNNVSLVINTCAIIDDMKPVVYEPQFLCDIANQNYTKYNISHKPSKYRKIGVMLKVNSTESIPFVVERFYSLFNPDSSFDLRNRISVPNSYMDSKGFTLSFTKGWKMNDNFFMLGADIYFSHLAEDLIYYSGNLDYTYVFLMALDGTIIFHPYYSRSFEGSQSAIPIDLEKVEKVQDINLLKRRLLTENRGVHETTRNNQTDLIQYYWRAVGNWYVLCVVFNTKFGPPSKLHESIWFRNEFLYHNLEDYKVCRHLNLLATTDVSSLYLSPSCFRSPYTAQHKMNAQVFIEYLKDIARLSVNPGLKDEVRDEVSLLSQVLDFLRKRHLSSSVSNYIVRRYATSNSGAFQMFPGSILKSGWMPTRSPWFFKAWQHKGRVVMVPPYLDRGGAGYVITLAYATSQLVVAMDLTYGYMLRILVKYIPSCLSENITCFIVDDEGYIIYHPNMRDVEGAKPVEQQHIVHKESLVSNDILNHKHFIKKLLCNSYGDNTIQRYYKLNTSFSDVLVNFVPGEHCVTYRITSVPNTNLFVGVVNTSCNFGATFCPCSIVDRLCLNCNRMEQKECECPCECPLDRGDICDTHLANLNMTDNLPCTRYKEDSLDSSFTVNTKSNLEPCFPITCHTQKSHLDCLGLLGCEWCLYDANRNYLRDPFCASIATCLNGVFDASETYLGHIPSSDFSSVVPILGSIIAITVIFVLLLICYRSYTHHFSERFFMSSTQDQLRMSDLNIADNFHDLGNHRDKLLQEEHPNVISPYCVASTYRRAAVPADSDHGYSTMTPHDESEHMSLAPVEVESLEDEIMSDSTSVHTSVSTKEAPKMLSPMFTRVPLRNCITVPVTVHRNMEKT